MDEIGLLREAAVIIMSAPAGAQSACSIVLSPSRMEQHEDRHARDLQIAWSFLDFLTPARSRLLRETFNPIESVERAPSVDVAVLLRITEEQALNVTKALTLPELRRRVDEVRDAVVTILDPPYSALLRETYDPPPVLYFRGNLELLSTATVAMVGSRRATPYGISIAHQIGRELGAAGLTIVSGLARGIDAAAHEAALRAGTPTIAVLGTGIDIVYPRFHRRLFAEIAENGLILTEFAPGTAPQPQNFPIRNRVIAGLCLGTIVVEASARSGSLITARLASEEGREVFAVPGSVLSPGSEGVHRLIQSGAKLVHNVNDVLEELRLPIRPAAAEPHVDENLREVLNLFSVEEAMHVDTAAARSGQSISSLAEKLLQLELEGLIRALPGSRYVRVV